MKIIKKLALALLALLVVLPAFAGQVTKERAAQVAASFFNGGRQRFGAKPGFGALSPSADASQAYMAFDRSGGGFVVVALNDAVPPILAYSNDGHFPAVEEMPENMRWWFSQLEARIIALGENAGQDAEIRKLWDNPTPMMAKSAEKLYETASWGQGTPFNDNCPEDGGDRCVTGCVATAGSIIARYFKWPDAGVGTIPAGPQPSPYGYGPAYAAHDLGHSYDWTNMPLSYSGGYTSAQAAAVATLMYDMGTMAKMSYGTDGSSANVGVLLAGLKQYMKYDKGAGLVNRVDYSDEAWKQLLTDVLDNYGPTLYSANDPYMGGHTFVVDGYDSAGRSISTGAGDGITAIARSGTWFRMVHHTTSRPIIRPL